MIKRLCWLAIALLWAMALYLWMTLPCDAAPFEIHPRTVGYRVVGDITLREPITDRLLGTYQLVTGGCGRGAAPWGKYEIGEYLTRGWIGPRWMIRHEGQGDGIAYDRRVGDARFDLELHGMHMGHFKCTLGCIGILGSEQVYDEFRHTLDYLIAWLGVVKFEFWPPMRIAR